MNDPRQGKPSGSSFDRIAACPGSVALIASLPKKQDVPDPDAERGTRLHRAWKLQDSTELPEEDIEDYEAGLRHIESLVSTWQMETQAYDVKELPREEREWLNAWNMDPVLSGEMDRKYIGKPGVMLILDTKSGWLTYVPPASESWQLRCYAVIAHYNHDPIKVRVAFVKPKAKADPIDYCDYSLEDLKESHKSILYHIWESERPNAPRHPGRHCRFCPAKASCPEAGAYYLLPSVLARENGVMDIVQRVNAMTPADLVRVFDAIPIITKIGEAVKTRLKGFTDEELKLLGLGRGKKKRLDPIVNTYGAITELQESLGTDLISLASTFSISKTLLTEFVRAKLNLSAADAKKWIARELEAFIEKKESEAPLIRLEE